MTAQVDGSSFLEAFRSALTILEDEKLKLCRQPKTFVRRDLSYGPLLEQYCILNKELFCTSDVIEGRNKFTYHLSNEFFRIDFRIVDGTVTDAWVVHELKGFPEPCPEMAMCLKSKDMYVLNLHICGFLEIYSPAKDKSQRMHLYNCLDVLDKDLAAIHHQSNVGLSPVNIAHHSPFGLICPRREGLATRIGFLVAPRNLLRGGKMPKDVSYCLIAAQKLGYWVSIGIREHVQSHRIPRLSVLKKSVDFTNETSLSDSSFIDVTENNSADLLGTFQMTFEKPFVIFDSNFKELHRVTNLKPNLAPGSMTRKFWENFGEEREALRDHVVEFFVILPGQHHCYEFDTSLPLSETITAIPFTHLRQIPPILKILRKQAVYNELLSSCIRDFERNAVVNPFRFRISLIPTGNIRLDFDHPLNSMPSRLEITLSDPVAPVCNFDCEPLLVTDELATRFLQRSLSISVALKSSIDHFVSNYVVPIPQSVFIDKDLPSPIRRSDSVIEIPYIPDQSPSNSLPSTPEILPMTPQTPGSCNPVISPPRFTKIESILAGGSKNLKFATPSSKAAPMDPTEHADRLKELYEANQKKMAKNDRVIDENGNRPKNKKRKISIDLGTSSAPTGAEPVAKYSAQFRASDESPHGSPLTVKFSKQPLNSDHYSQQAGVNRDLTILPKKKKQKVTEMISAMATAPQSFKNPEKKAKTNPSELESLLLKKRPSVPVSSPSKTPLSKSPSLASVLNASPRQNTVKNLISTNSPRLGTTASSKYPGFKSSSASTSATLSKPLTATSSKSPTTIQSAPLFSVPKMPSLNGLPRIPKKNAAGSAPPAVIVKPPAFSPVATVAGISQADLVAISEIGALISNPSLGRPPLLPTPNIATKPISTLTSPPYTEKVIALPPAPELISLGSADLNKSFEEDAKKAESSSPELPSSSSSKIRNRSLSAVLDRLKSRVEPSDNSHDSSDMHDMVFRHAAGSGDSMDRDSTSPAPATNISGIESAAGETKKMDGDSVENVKSLLVPYSEDDSSEEGDLLTNEVVLKTTTYPHSPEILEPKNACISFPVLTTDESSRIVGAPEEYTAGKTESSAGAPSSPGESRPSPVIYNDDLLDLAFCASDETDKD